MRGATVFASLATTTLILAGLGAFVARAGVTPPAPPYLYAEGGEDDKGRPIVLLAWLPSPSANLLGYRVYRGDARDNLTFYWETSSREIAFVDRDVQMGGVYFYTVSAFNEHGEGPISIVIWASPCPYVPCSNYLHPDYPGILEFLLPPDLVEEVLRVTRDPAGLLVGAAFGVVAGERKGACETKAAEKTLPACASVSGLGDVTVEDCAGERLTQDFLPAPDLTRDRYGVGYEQQCIGAAVSGQGQVECEERVSCIAASGRDDASCAAQCVLVASGEGNAACHGGGRGPARIFVYRFRFSELSQDRLHEADALPLSCIATSGSGDAKCASVDQPSVNSGHNLLDYVKWEDQTSYASPCGAATATGDAQCAGGRAATLDALSPPALAGAPLRIGGGCIATSASGNATCEGAEYAHGWSQQHENGRVTSGPCVAISGTGRASCSTRQYEVEDTRPYVHDGTCLAASGGPASAECGDCVALSGGGDASADCTWSENCLSVGADDAHARCDASREKPWADPYRPLGSTKGTGCLSLAAGGNATCDATGRGDGWRFCTAASAIGNSTCTVRGTSSDSTKCRVYSLFGRSDCLTFDDADCEVGAGTRLVGLDGYCASNEGGTSACSSTSDLPSLPNCRVVSEIAQLCKSPFAPPTSGCRRSAELGPPQARIGEYRNCEKGLEIPGYRNRNHAYVRILSGEYTIKPHLGSCVVIDSNRICM